MSEIITAEHICQALESTYTSPEWYLGFEVGNSTGTSCKRHADAVAINAYPSKGFEVRGFEIKVTKQDLAVELQNGIKSEEIAKYCDYWFLVTPKGLSDSFTLPPTWGVIEYHDGKLRQKMKATKLEKASPTAGFLCAMLRGRERVVAMSAAKITSEREAQIRRETRWSAGNAESELKRLKEQLNEIKASTGIDLGAWTPTQSIIDRLNAVSKLNIVTHNVRAIERASKLLLENAQEIQTAASGLLTKESEGNT